MLRIEMIGNLGADAEVKDNNGRKFISFRVAHTDKWKDPTSGQEHVSTVWASCALNGDGGKLLQYLKKGIKVFLRGSMSLNTYSSPKTHQIECGLNISVWELELCSSQQQEQQQPAQPAPTPSVNTENANKSNKKKK